MENWQAAGQGHSSKQNDNIQHLRAIACLFILCHHFQWLQPAIPQVLWSAWSGVDLFFAISGYVIALSFSRAIVVRSEDTRFAEKISLNSAAIQVFFIKRFWRIFPPVVVTLVLLAFLTLTLGITRWTDLLVEAAAALSMTYNYVVYDGGPFVLDILWSLGVEAQFYLLVPFFLIACSNSRRGLIITTAVFLLIGAIVRPLHIHAYTELSQHWLAVRFSTHCRLDSLAAGVLVYFLLREPKVVQSARNLSVFAVRSLFLFCLLVLLYIPAYTPIEFSHSEGFSLLAIASASILFLAAGSGRRLIPGAQFRTVFCYLGERSFSIYLVHRLAGAAFSGQFPSIIILERALGVYGIMMRLVNGIYVTFFTLILAEFMYRFVEIPSIKAGRYYSAKLSSHQKLRESGRRTAPLDARKPYGTA
jgi:peptidoglycan/LPS O-acetylase OafA/YrhL